MMLERRPVVLDHDVYALTEKGVDGLRSAEASLSPVEIKLLVLTDGRSTVAQVKASQQFLGPEVVAETYQKLLLGGWIRPASREKDGKSDLYEFFSTKPPLKPSAGAISKAGPEASAGVTKLQEQGYYVSIAHRPAIERQRADGESLSAVVVEDEPNLAKFLKHYLEFEKIDVRLAANRDEIIAALRRPPLPDLVLLDVILPDADGFDVLLKMREHPVLKSVPVIMLTAKATREAVLKGLAGGANGYVTKPFEAEVLIKAVRIVLGLPLDPAAQPGGNSWY